MIKRNLLVMGLAVLLSACGFQLRGTGTNQLTITELDVSARNAYGDTVRELRQTLENSGVKISTSAPLKLILTSEEESQRAASYTGTSYSAEYELTNVLKYEIKGQNNLPLLNNKIEVHKMLPARQQQPHRLRSGSGSHSQGNASRPRTANGAASGAADAGTPGRTAKVS